MHGAQLWCTSQHPPAHAACICRLTSLRPSGALRRGVPAARPRGPVDPGQVVCEPLRPRCPNLALASRGYQVRPASAVSRRSQCRPSGRSVGSGSHLLCCACCCPACYCPHIAGRCLCSPPGAAPCERPSNPCCNSLHKPTSTPTPAAPAVHDHGLGILLPDPRWQALRPDRL